MCNALVVARWRHAVMAAQGLEAVREVGLGGFIQVFEAADRLSVRWS